MLQQYACHRRLGDKSGHFVNNALVAFLFNNVGEKTRSIIVVNCNNTLLFFRR